MAADSIRDAGGCEKRLDAIAKGLPSRSHRMTAFAMACEVCVSDAQIPEGEIRFLEQLQRALSLDEETARDIFEAARKESGLLTIEEKTKAMRAMMPAFVDCMALMAAADGEVHSSEMDGVRAVLRNIPDMAVLSRDELDTAIQKAFQRIRDKDCHQELEAIARSTITAGPDRYWTTVYMMIIALADGRSDWREVRFLETASRVFALSEAQMDQAMETAALFPAVKLGGAAPSV
jgi:tellurite resistance protein